MIGRLTGQLVASEADGSVVMDVHGVGYEVMVPLGSRLPPVGGGTPVTLHIHTVVREDSLELFGFAELEQRRLFRLLIAVPNVGPKTAICALGGMSVDELVQSIRAEDSAALARLPGIGKKTAERIILELQAKVDGLAVGTPPTKSLGGSDGKAERLAAALTQMGYRASEAARAVELLKDQLASLSAGELLREALGLLSRR